LRAGLIYNTWPLIDGTFVPAASQLFFAEPGWRNVFENPLTAQFDHRMVAYLLFGLTALHAIRVARTHRSGAALPGALALVGAVTLQATLGIFTLLAQAPLALALTHQGMAMIVLTVATLHAQRVAAQEKPVAAHDADSAGKLGAVAGG